MGGDMRKTVPDGILVRVIQPREITLFEGKVGIPEIMSNLAAGNAIQFIYPFRHPFVKLRQHRPEAGRVLRVFGRIGDKMIMI
jgi:hypothetical protein